MPLLRDPRFGQAAPFWGHPCPQPSPQGRAQAPSMRFSPRRITPDHAGPEPLRARLAEPFHTPKRCASRTTSIAACLQWRDVCIPCASAAAFEIFYIVRRARITILKKHAVSVAYSQTVCRRRCARNAPARCNALRRAAGDALPHTHPSRPTPPAAGLLNTHPSKLSPAIGHKS